MGAIHSSKISEISVQNSMERFSPSGKVKKKTGPPFEVDYFSRSDQLEFWLNGLHPIIKDELADRLFMPIRARVSILDPVFLRPDPKWRSKQ